MAPSNTLPVIVVGGGGKNLSAIFITCADPDFHFGPGPVVEAFPDAKVLATPVTVQAIVASVEHKIEVWRPKLGGDGPNSLAETVIPTAYTDPTLNLDDTVIVIQTARQENRCNLWVPSLAAILGGVQIVGGIMFGWPIRPPSRNAPTGLHRWTT